MNFVSLWTFDLQSGLEILELFAVQFGVDSRVRKSKFVIEYSLKIPLNWHHHRFWMQIGFQFWFWHFSSIDPLTLACVINLDDSLLINSDDLLEKPVWVGLWQQRIGEMGPLLDNVGCHLGCGIHYLSLWTIRIWFTKMFDNSRVVSGGLFSISSRNRCKSHSIGCPDLGWSSTNIRLKQDGDNFRSELNTQSLFGEWTKMFNRKITG